MNAATDFAVSASNPNENPRTVRYAPAALSVIPTELLENRFSFFFDSLLKRRHNSRNWVWSSVENGRIRGAGMAHIIYCSVEMYAWSSEPQRRSLCVSKVVGDQTKVDIAQKCNVYLTSQLLIGDYKDATRNERKGTMACWCQQACTTKSAVYVNKTEEGILQQVRGYAVVQEMENGLSVPVEQYENENNFAAEQWYEENLVQAKSPAGKGLFPREARGKTAVRSLRIVNLLSPSSPSPECQVDRKGIGQDDVGRRTTARVEEEMGLALQRGISAPLSKVPAGWSEIAMAIVTALAAAMAFESKDFCRRLLMCRKNEVVGWRRHLWTLALVLAFLAEPVVELSPIYLILMEEVQALRLVETTMFEIIGAGNELGILPIVNRSREQFVEVTTAVVIIVLRNKRTSIVTVVIIAVALTCVSLYSVVKKARLVTRQRANEILSKIDGVETESYEEEN